MSDRNIPLQRERKKAKPVKENLREFELDLPEKVELHPARQPKSKQLTFLQESNLGLEDPADLNGEHKQEVINRLIGFFQPQTAEKRSKL
jgi:hypothetical protein